MLTFKKCLPVVIIAAMATMVGCGPSSPTPKKPTQPTQPVAINDQAVTNSDTKDIDIKKVSEALGHFIGRNLNSPGVNFDLDNVIKGMREGAEGKPAPMSEQDYEKAMGQLQQQAVTALAAKNLEAADAFMKDNAKVSGVVEIVPGKLQYTILSEGTGPVVPEHGTPLINYTGKYADGTVFGSSDAAGGPITVPIDQTIPGFSKGIAGMKEGEKRRLFVHPEMGYGTTGQLPPNSLLIFDIDVVKAESPDKETAEAFQSKVNEDLDDESDDEDAEDFDEQDDSAPAAKK
ncbi:MAG: FKBP-type peptidyl-prolyl cis-trans isomerase [Parachlamydiaceae bacterium]